MSVDAAIGIPFHTSPSDDMTVSRHALGFSDGYETSLIEWAGPGEPTGLPVLFMHGIQSHPGWFSRSAEAIARAGHRVFMLTRRGSGDNASRRGDTPSVRRLMRDVDETLDAIENATGVKQSHAVGVSWGGKWLTGYCGHGGGGGQARLRSLVLSTPGLVSRVKVSGGVKTMIGLSLLSWPARRFAIPLSDPQLFADDQETCDFVRDDPCRLHRGTARFLFASRVMDERIVRMRARSLTVPTTLLLARRDRIIDNAHTHALVRRLTGDSAHVETFDAAHTLDFVLDPSSSHRAICDAFARAEG
jgi:acylglycerol lipase